MKKIKLNELKVQSFVTELEDKSKRTIQGGASAVPIAPGHCIEQSELDATGNTQLSIRVQQAVNKHVTLPLCVPTVALCTIMDPGCPRTFFPVCINH